MKGQRVAALSAELRRRHPGWRPDLILSGSGLESEVYRAVHPEWGGVAIKVPRTRFINNDNDSAIDARELLRQEALLSGLGHRHGVPAPCVFDLCLDGRDTDHLIASFVRHDGSAVSSRACGAALARIHAIRLPPGFKCVAEIGSTLAETIATLIMRRSRTLGRLTGAKLPVPAKLWIEQELSRYEGPAALLHMDFRPANILADRRRIAGVVDWANALVGDPALEAARVAEYGLWNEDFAAGYGSDPLSAAPPRTVLLYRLYTATMLAIVFASEAPDPAKARQSVSRVQSLYRKLGKHRYPAARD